MKKIILISLGLALLAAACNRKQSAITTPTPVVSSDSKAEPAKPKPVVVLPLHGVGQITRHASGFINQEVRIQGYVLKKEANYIIFSDESGGAINKYDLPVAGSGIETIEPKHVYELQGTFLDHGLKASNGSLNHLELSVVPKLIK